MATLTITVDNDQATRMVAAARAKVHIPGGDAMSAMDFAKAVTIRWWVELTRDYEREIAQASVQTTDITPT